MKTKHYFFNVQGPPKLNKNQLRTVLNIRCNSLHQKVTKMDQHGPNLGPSWAQVGLKNRSKIGLKRILTKKHLSKPSKSQNYLNLNQKAVPGPQLRPNKGSKSAYEGSKFVYRGSKLAPKPYQIQAFWNDKRSSR